MQDADVANILKTDLPAGKPASARLLLETCNNISETNQLFMFNNMVDKVSLIMLSRALPHPQW
jgi:hypothetical protein